MSKNNGSEVTETVKKPKKRGSKFLSEFGEFALRGNVIDLAVGVIIGGAFQKIVSSLVDDIIMPIVTFFTGGVNFNDKFWILKNSNNIPKAEITSIAAAKEKGIVVFGYGSFITAIINFIILAVIIFIMIRGLNRLMKKYAKSDEKSETKKECPHCFMEVDTKATRCPYCTSELELSEVKEKIKS